ncbi:MAG: 4-oxalocrotonate tautomerase [Alicyclobacillaceae bacterium]|nr:4-oxalocrotonate tautomerase [Alicyclobacillaceae bacterium]
MPFIHVELLEGRSLDQKRRLVEAITRAVAESLQISEDRVHIFLRDLKKEEYARAGKLVADEQ